MTEATRVLQQQYLRSQAIAAGSVASVAAGLFSKMVDPNNLDRSFREYSAATTAAVRMGQGSVSATAAEFYMSHRAASGVTGSEPAVRAVRTPSAALQTSLVVTGPVSVKRAMRRGMGVEEAMRVAGSATSGAVYRHVANAGRDTITDLGRRDPARPRFARVSDGDPCDFCAMLLSRGAVYLDESTAAGFSYHDRCGCYAVPVYGGSFGDFPEGTNGEAFRRLWERAGGDLATFRVLYAEARRSGTLEAARRPVVAARTSVTVRTAAPSPTGFVAVQQSVAMLDAAQRAKRLREWDLPYLTRNAESWRARVADALEEGSAALASYQRALARAERKLKQTQNAIATYEERATGSAIAARLKKIEAKKSVPMTPAAALDGANPGWLKRASGTQTNCTRCAASYEMRRRGYAVKAERVKTTDKGTKYDDAIVDKWRDPATGAQRKFSPLYSGSDIEGSGGFGGFQRVSDSAKPAAAQLEAVTAGDPVGSRYFVVGSWKRGGAHIWNAEKTESGIRFADAQSGADAKAGGVGGIASAAPDPKAVGDMAHTFDPEINLSRLKLQTVRLMRVDDLVPTEELATWVKP